MTHQQSTHTESPSKHSQYESEIRAGVRLLVEMACGSGFTREEVLIAISDAADAELADLTETAPRDSLFCPDIVPFRKIVK